MRSSNKWKILVGHWTLIVGRQNARLLHWPKCSCVSRKIKLWKLLLRPAVCMSSFIVQWPARKLLHMIVKLAYRTLQQIETKLRAPQFLNNISFSARAQCPGTGTKSRQELLPGCEITFFVKVPAWSPKFECEFLSIWTNVLLASRFSNYHT